MAGVYNENALERWFFAVCLPLCVFAQDPLPDTSLLERARIRAAENLEKLPNYTCLQTIERSVRRAPARRLRLIDMVRLEVALVNGKELFSWPGARHFADTEITDLVTGGAIGNGDFAQFARSIFLTRAPEFQPAGERILGGRKTIGWNYRVPQARSGYTFRVRPNAAIVGYHGSIWVDARSFDLVKLEITADEMPPLLQTQSASSVIEYARVAIGGGTFLLPLRSELTVIDLDGSESRNRTSFSQCRQYAGESKLSFEEPAELDKAAETVSTVELPGGLSLNSVLETPVAFGKSAVGDPVTARVRSNVKKDGKILVPKGALLHGRISLLREQNLALRGYVVGLHFFALEWPGHRAEVDLRLEYIPGHYSHPDLTQYTSRNVLERQMRQAVLQIAAPGSVFFVKGTSVELRRGLLMQWRTRLPSEQKIQ